MYDVKDWAEVHRLFHREGVAKARIAGMLGMSRNRVDRLLSLDAPPSSRRERMVSKLDPAKDEVRRTLPDDPEVAATVICKRLRPGGFDGSASIVKRFVAEVRPGFARMEAFGREGHRPGGLARSTAGVPARVSLWGVVRFVWRWVWW